ncbi:MAG: ribosome-recycling factor [Deltaproteobacteria bacterium]|nr:ribosome-recycling factor [Deltaproteobacteria bacterium]
MSDDTFKDGKFLNNDGFDRETDVSSPSDSLLMQAKGVGPGENSQTEDGAQLEARVSSSVIPPREGVRFSTDTIDTRALIKKGVFVGGILLAFLLGLIISGAFFGNRKIAKLESRFSTTEAKLGACVEKADKCVGELSGCVRDFKTLNSVKASAGMNARDFRVEKARKRKMEAEEGLAGTRRVLLDRLDTMKKSGAISRKYSKELQENVDEFRKLSDEATRTKKEYKEALAASAIRPAGTPDPELTERNKRRAAFLAEEEKTPTE